MDSLIMFIFNAISIVIGFIVIVIYVFILFSDEKINVNVKLIENGMIPQYKREKDACLDCYSRINLVIKKGERKLVPLGFALELPTGFEAIVRPRSGLSKDSIDVIEGTVDETYRGEVMANVVNNSDNDFEIYNGDRICQLAIREVTFVRMNKVDSLSETERGMNGFGSSGLR